MSLWKKILCPTDFSEPSYAALKTAHQLATELGAELYVLHVMEEMAPVLGLVSEEEFDQLRRDETIQRIQQEVRVQLGEGVKVRPLTGSGVAATEILRISQEEKADVIVIATHGLTGWRRLVYGSVAEAVGRQAQCPILIIHRQPESEESPKEEASKTEAAKSGEPDEESDSCPPNNKWVESRTTDTWHVKEESFPSLGERSDKLRFLLNYAILAPSSHNAQPWKWRFDGDTLELYADYSRLLPSSDPFSRELIISCGAALFNLRTAIRRFGYVDEVQVLPDLYAPDLLARIDLGPHRLPTDAEHLLFNAIQVRHTYRFPFKAQLFSQELLLQLKAAARQESGMLRFVDLDCITALVEDGNEIHNEDSSFLRELRQWIIINTSSGEERRDGIPLEALGESGMALQWKSGQNSETQNSQALEADSTLLRSASAIAVLESECDTPLGWLAAGQALEHVLLLARVHGVYASYFNQPTQVRELWTQLRQALGPEHGLSYYPQLVFRLGTLEKGTEIIPTPRRPVEEVLDEDLRPNPALTQYVSTYR